jgi:hypothetical protein
MAFDGCYPRLTREAGRVHRIFVRRVRCATCEVGDALLPDFVLRGRRDTTASVGAAILPRLGIEVPEATRTLYAGVPGRTVRSWRQRFAERADQLALRLDALCVQWGETLPLGAEVPAPGPPRRAVLAMGRFWRAARRRCSGEVPAAWSLANVVVGGQLISTRVDLPWPIVPGRIGRSRAP